MSPLLRRTPALVGLTAFSWLGSAWAAPCGRPDVDATFPPDRAHGVPSNASLAAHYASPALYDDESVSVTDSAGNEVSVTVTYDDADSMLRVAPEQALSEGTYRVAWPGLRGVSSSGVGRGSTTSFDVTSTADNAAPVFAGLDGISWDLARDRDPCLDQLDDRFTFKLQVGRASDDSGTELLALVPFQTVDPLAPERAGPSNLGVFPWPSDGTLELRRPATKAGKTCFAAVARDLVGAVSGGGEREVCVQTQRPPFFEGCALTARPGRSAPQAAVGVGLVLAGLALLRRGRAAHARAPRAG